MAVVDTDHRHRNPIETTVVGAEANTEVVEGEGIIVVEVDAVPGVESIVVVVVVVVTTLITFTVVEDEVDGLREAAGLIGRLPPSRNPYYTRILQSHWMEAIGWRNAGRSNKR